MKGYFSNTKTLQLDMTELEFKVLAADLESIKRYSLPDSVLEFINIVDQEWEKLYGAENYTEEYLDNMKNYTGSWELYKDYRMNDVVFVKHLEKNHTLFSKVPYHTSIMENEPFVGKNWNEFWDLIL